MKYLTAYFWQREKENACSLVLQQAAYEKGQNVLLACICEGADKAICKEGRSKYGEYLTECLRDWFYDEVLFKGPKSSFASLQRWGTGLTQIIKKAEKEAGRCPVKFCGIFCMGNSFFVFSRGSEIIIQNTRFGEANIKSIFAGEEEFCLEYGTLQCGVGVLLVSSELLEGLSGQHIKECLMVEEIHSKEQAGKHLRELCHTAAVKDARDMAAVFLLAQ